MIKSWLSVLCAYVSAAAAAAMVTAVEITIAAVVITMIEPSSFGGLMMLAPVAALLWSFIIFAGGLLLVGTPIWLALTVVKRTSIKTFAVVGGVASWLGATIIALSVEETSLSLALGYGAIALLPGAAAGTVLRRVAYAKPKPPRRSPARPS